MPDPFYIDTHAHLCDPRFDEDRSAVVARARTAGVLRIVEIADSPADWDKARALCRAEEGMRCALGLHPYHADQWRDSLPDELLEASKDPRVAAVGEIGLDYAKCAIPPDAQKTAFRGMLAAAERAGLPVVLHCREAYPDMLAILRDLRAAPPSGRRFRGVMHCFSGSAQEALETVRLGFALGVDGPVTYPKNAALREALAGVGVGSLVLETDSPYLPPQSSRGKRNEPATVPEIAARLAETLGLSAREVAEATSRNARDLFGIDG